MAHAVGPSAPSLPHEIQINLGATYYISGPISTLRTAVLTLDFSVRVLREHGWSELGDSVASGASTTDSHDGMSWSSVAPAILVHLQARAANVRLRALSGGYVKPYTSYAELNILGSINLHGNAVLSRAEPDSVVGGNTSPGT